MINEYFDHINYKLCTVKSFSIKKLTRTFFRNRPLKTSNNYLNRSAHFWPINAPSLQPRCHDEVGVCAVVCAVRELGGPAGCPRRTVEDRQSGHGRRLGQCGGRKQRRTPPELTDRASQRSGRGKITFRWLVDKLIFCTVSWLWLLCFTSLS